MARNNTERKTRSALTDVVAREYTIRLHTAVHGKGFKHVGSHTLDMLSIAFPRWPERRRRATARGRSIFTELRRSPLPFPPLPLLLHPPLRTDFHICTLMLGTV